MTAPKARIALPGGFQTLGSSQIPILKNCRQGWSGDRLGCYGSDRA